ncbi:MAG: 16S rRNA (cytosine1402-N4)-methyltransferase [Saprospiraceae bacterium]|jgi:16S rRNA (cytosine1402-N4)-methyltransferase
MDNSKYHIPVLLKECLDALIVNPDGVYIDVTFGGGGHSKEILNRLTAKGRLFGFDQDEQALENAIDDERFVMVHGNFRFLKHFMAYYGLESVQGILADLGVSSFHFNEAERGFSYRFDAALDMRMNTSALTTAQDILISYSQAELQRIFSEYGEIRNAKTLAKVIVETRRDERIVKTSDLLRIVDKIYRGDRQKYASQVFQALRIEVNDEMGVLRRFMGEGLELLASGGRMVVMSYHSLEDKIVKQYMRSGSGKDVMEYDNYGRAVEKYKSITRKPVIPSQEEIKINSRAASAKLRVTEKI